MSAYSFPFQDGAPFVTITLVPPDSTLAKPPTQRETFAVDTGMDEALKAVQEDEVRRSISDWALRLEMNRDNVLKFLSDALQETDKKIRTWAAQKPGEIGDKRAIRPLKEALTKEEDAETKKAIEEAIGKLEK